MTWQPTAVLYPDVETSVTAGIRALLASHGAGDVYVGRKVPKPRRARMVIVNRDGGAASEFRDRARVRVRVWDETDAAVNDLAALVVALAPLLVSSGVALRVEHLSGPVDITDDDKTPARYLLFEIHTRGVAL